MIKKIIILFILTVSVFIQVKFFGTYQIDGDVISNLIIFLSIVFGFCTTSLSIFATSRYVSKLYKEDDIKKPSQTLLHKLVKKYKAGLIFSLITIVYLVLVHLVTVNYFTGLLSLSDPLSFALLPLMIVNFYYCFSLLNILSSVVIQEAKTQE